MKTIYLFEYKFKQDQSPSPSKNGIFNYKTFVIVDDEGHDIMLGAPDYVPFDGKLEAINKFRAKYPHVNMTTVQISQFKGDIIDSCEPAN